MSHTLFTLTIFEIAGVCGFCLYVMNYAMLTFRKLSGDHIIYYIINFSAASLVLIGLTASFNLAAALVQGFWILMSTIGITLRVIRKSRVSTFPA